MFKIIVICLSSLIAFSSSKSAELADLPEADITRLVNSMNFPDFNANAAFNTAAAKNDCLGLDYLSLFYPRLVNEEYDGALPLSLAASHGCFDAVAKLTGKCATIDAQDSYGNTALIWSILTKNEYALDESIIFEIAEWLLNFGANPNLSNCEGKSPLMLASAKGYTSIARLLIEYEAEVDQLDFDGQSALYLALVNGHAETVTLLLEHNAFLNLENSYSNGQMLNIISLKGGPDIINLFIDLISEYENQTELQNLLNHALFYAIGSKKLQNVTTLVKRGANVLALNDNDYSTLHQSVISMRTNLIDFFIAHGVNLNGRNNKKDTPLHIASQLNFTKGIEILLNNRARTDLANAEGLLPIETAVINGSNEAVIAYKPKSSLTELKRALLSAASMCNVPLLELLVSPKTIVARNNKLHTPLMIVAMKGDIVAIEILYNAGCGIDLEDDQGSTALHLAYLHRQNDTAAFLITKCGSSKNKQDKQKKTPLHICVIKNNEEGVKTLLKYGADKTIKNKQGETPRAIAQKLNKLELVALLK